MNLKKLLLAASLLSATALVNATPVLTGALQNGLDNLTLDGQLDINVNDENQQYNPDEMWQIDSVSQANTVLAFELAGFASTTTFGIYDLNSSSTLELFTGPASTGFSTTLRQVGNTFLATMFDSNGFFLSQTTADFGGDQNFGFYLTTQQNNTFYSQSALNGDYNNDGIDDDHLVSFQGNDVDRLDPDNDGLYGLFSSNNFILAWEDLRFDGADRDYTDMVVMVESFVPVPEPTPLAILAVGLAGLAFTRRKTK
ncbi:PEP-CTERM sorting domain-containing protein [Brumicola blandensis]|jgi:hypothetical protein|uniref:PEP-CTERM sorting domain-containing protein n=1 Tax=Brumicola blandensis TaxID=3075611 RepID=A0AAW8R0W5_9ALTE|nr:PEP-CTERM sorting domain-containing protein [Alteromonas sp. W409]MDT0582669.1 PEP-CTERM sorting domain-containing protein [Alteromonas sp. W409]